MSAASDRSEPPPTRHGHRFDEAASSLQKSIRRSDVEAAVYWTIELLEHTPHYVWHRLKVIASEDIGLAGDPALPATLHALHVSFDEGRKRKGGGDSGLFAVHAAMLLARSRKSSVVAHCLLAVAAEGPREVPDHALDKHTQAGRQMGRGWDHFWAEAALLVDPDTGEIGPAPCMPDPWAERAKAYFERSPR